MREVAALNRTLHSVLSDRFINEEENGHSGNTSEEGRVRRNVMFLQESVKKRISEYLLGHVQDKLLVLQHRLTECQEMASREPGQVPAALEEIRSELRNIQQEGIRRASQELYPSIVKAGLVPAVRSAVNRFSSDILTELFIEPEIERRERDDQRYYPEEYRLGVYRIIEESPDRVVKLSQATLAKVSVACENNEYLSIQLSDNGTGISTEGVMPSEGLAGIRDYAQLLGGACEVVDPGRPRGQAEGAFAASPDGTVV